jgi:glutamate racemase
LRDDRPIGIFDSGIGGLTVANAILQRLPKERIVYFGDTAHLPYGDKSAKAIRHYAEGITNFLLAQSCKAIVIACNSATSAAYAQLLRRYGDQVPIINVIDPIIEEVAARPDLHTIGVIGTKATIRAGMFPRKFRLARPDLVVRSQATPLLAPMIEEGFFNNKISRAVLDSYLSKPLFKGIQGLIMACTHYPLIRPDIEALYAGKNVELFDTPGVVARAVAGRLEQHGLLRPRRSPLPHAFYVSDYTDSFERTTRIFWGEKVHLEEARLWE